jgi:hypothetical protein
MQRNRAKPRRVGPTSAHSWGRSSAEPRPARRGLQSAFPQGGRAACFIPGGALSILIEADPTGGLRGVLLCALADGGPQAQLTGLLIQSLGILQEL